jgi:hypothetical protein
MKPIHTAPRDPGVPINTDIGIVGWAQRLHKTPPPFLERANYVPEISREEGWRRMVETDVMGWAFVSPMEIVHPTEWEPITPHDRQYR